MILYTSSVIKLDIILSKYLTRTYITTANYLKLHKTFLCFENKYGQTGKPGSKTDWAVIRAAIGTAKSPLVRSPFGFQSPNKVFLTILLLFHRASTY